MTTEGCKPANRRERTEQQRKGDATVDEGPGGPRGQLARVENDSLQPLEAGNLNLDLRAFGLAAVAAACH